MTGLLRRNASGASDVDAMVRMRQRVAAVARTNLLVICVGLEMVIPVEEKVMGEESGLSLVVSMEEVALEFENA